MVNIIRIALLSLIFNAALHAKPLTMEQVPEPLKPWVNWVLQDQEELGCPFSYNQFEAKTCSWPANLTLDFSAASGKFIMSWRVYRESWVALPGNRQYWPQNVKVNNQAREVLDKNGMPAMKLPAGLYRIEGEFFWKAIPESLNIPAAAGLVGLQVNGEAVAVPVIRDGLLWLSETDTGRKQPENVQNSLDVQAFRLITDTVPMQVTTRLVLSVSGEQREVKLALPVLEGFVPFELTSELPARIEPDGQLLVQVRPGQWGIDILSQSKQEINELKLTSGSHDWPASEIWAFAAQPNLRVVEVEKLLPIDASQTNLPDEWRQYPSYSVNLDESMTFKVVRRGDAEPEANQLTLMRQLWLDFDGGGYSVHDAILGKMSKDWRLDAHADTQLGRVDLNGDNQLITVNQATGREGVEVRQGELKLAADSRLKGNISQLNAAGWLQKFNQVKAELNLPPGWRLLAASGVDNVPDSWVARWTLLDLFLVLIAALATARLFSRNWGLFAGLALALIWHENGAPQMLWLNILAATALIRVLPPGRFCLFATWYRRLGWLALVLVLAPFLADQVRTGLYPQLERPWAEIVPQYEQSQSGAGMMAKDAEVAMAPAAPAVSAPEESLSYEIKAKRGRIYSPKLAESVSDDVAGKIYQTYDPDAKVQTGPGLPQWQWHRTTLVWNGSVDVNQEVRLWYLSPKVLMLLNFLRVILTCGLALLMFGMQDRLTSKRIAGAQLGLWLFLLPLLTFPGQDVQADMPSQEVLAELKKRLLEAPDCLPNCAQIPHLRIKVNKTLLTLNLQVHAQEAVNVPLPAAYEQWFPNQVAVDGQPAQGLYRLGNTLWLNVEAGAHDVAMAGAPPVLTSFTLPLALPPARVTVEAEGWQIGGIQDNGQVESQLQFTRTGETVGGVNAKRLAPGVLPPFVRLQRRLQLGLDWHVANQVSKESSGDAAVVLAIPLLPGEKVTTPGVEVKDHKIQVNLAAQHNQFSWDSTLEKAESVALKADDSGQWTEVWQADVSPIWHLETKGFPMIRQDGSGQWLPEWHPWPGELLTLTITRPKAVEGQTLTVDQSHLSIRPGQRSTDADLKFTLRSSQGAQHTIKLPEAAVLQNLAVNGQALPPRQEGRLLTLPVNPGKQEVAVTWQQPGGIAWLTRTPEVDLNLPSVNSKLGIGLGQDRWTVFLWGPKLGPAVLFWGALAVIVIFALGLAKIPLTPLKFGQWFLLLLGLSQVPVEAAGFIVAWLLLLGWRLQHQVNNRRLFNLLQFGLGLLTLIALAILVFAVEQGLLGGQPDMQISGNQSSAFDFNWYQDRSGNTLPQALVVSMPMLAYRLLMLLWSFWLASALLNWLKWGWQCYTHNGFWRKKPVLEVKTKPAENIEKTPK